jgi:hypothetical protein
VVQNRWRVGWVVISRKNILRQKWYTFACKKHNEAYWFKKKTVQTKWYQAWYV